MKSRLIKIIASFALLTGGSAAHATPSCEIISQSVLSPSQGLKVGENGFMYADIEHSCPAGYSVYIESPSIKPVEKTANGVKYKFELAVVDEQALTGSDVQDSNRCESNGSFGNRNDGGCWFYNAGSSDSDTIIKTRFVVRYGSSGTSPSETLAAREAFQFKYSLSQL